MDEEPKLSIQENVSVIKLDGTFKSWREEYTCEDVEKHLVDSGITEFVYDGICGDGDILLVTNKGMLTCVALSEIIKVKLAFSAPKLVIEPYEGELMLTLSWNTDV